MQAIPVVAAQASPYSMKILITGSNGFVGAGLIHFFLQKGHQVFATSFSDDLSPFASYTNYRFIRADFTDTSQCDHLLDLCRPHVVIHSGAMSKPDDCELQKSKALLVNATATGYLLNAAWKHGSQFILLSTDFVFDGHKRAHAEEDEPLPLSWYGHTKAEAEKLVLSYEYFPAVVRIVFVYGRSLFGRKCFPEMIADKLRNNISYKVVNDQFRTPTHIDDVSKGIDLVIQRKATGIFHIAGKNVLTPYDIAIATAALLCLDAGLLTPVSTASLNEIARRPLYGGLNISKAINELGYEPIDFYEGLKKTFY